VSLPQPKPVSSKDGRASPERKRRRFQDRDSRAENAISLKSKVGEGSSRERLRRLGNRVLPPPISRLSSRLPTSGNGFGSLLPRAVQPLLIPCRRLLQAARRTDRECRCGHMTLQGSLDVLPPRPNNPGWSIIGARRRRQAADPQRASVTTTARTHPRPSLVWRSESGAGKVTLPGPMPAFAAPSPAGHRPLCRG
jgi:hypothetical protein